MPRHQKKNAARKNRWRKKELLKKKKKETSELHVSDAEECKESDNYVENENSEAKENDKEKSEGSIEEDSGLHESKSNAEECIQNKESELEHTDENNREDSSDVQDKNKKEESKNTYESYAGCSKDQEYVEESRNRKLNSEFYRNTESSENKENEDEEEEEEGACALPPEYYENVSDINSALLFDLIESNQYITVSELVEIFQQPEQVIYRIIRDEFGYDFIEGRWTRDEPDIVTLDIREDRSLWGIRNKQYDLTENVNLKRVSFDLAENTSSSETSTASTTLDSSQSTPSSPQEEEEVMNILFDLFRSNPTITVEEAAELYKLPKDYVQMIYYDFERSNGSGKY